MWLREPSPRATDLVCELNIGSLLLQRKQQVLICLAYVGSVYLARTTDPGDLILNAVALEFILEADNLIFERRPDLPSVPEQRGAGGNGPSRGQTESSFKGDSRSARIRLRVPV